MIEVPRDQLVHDTNYFVRRITYDPMNSGLDNSTKYRGVFVDHHMSFGNIVTTFRDMRNVNPNRVRLPAPSVLVNPIESYYMWSFYVDSAPIIQTRLRQRILIGMGLTDDVVDLIMKRVVE